MSQYISQHYVYFVKLYFASIVVVEVFGSILYIFLFIFCFQEKKEGQKHNYFPHNDNSV